MNSTVFKALISSRFAALKYSLFSNTRKRGKRTGAASDNKGTMILYAILFLYVFGVFAALFFGLYSQLAEPYHAVGLDWVYFAMYAITDFALMFIGTVFTAKVQLFEARDNDLLLSMPIPSKYILMSRMAMLLGMNMLFGLVVSVPVLLAWIINGRIDTLQIVLYIVTSLLIPFFSISISALFGWLISLLTRRVRRKSLLTTVFSIAFLVLYFFAINRMNTFIASLIANGQVVADKLGAVAPLYWIGSGIGNVNIGHFFSTVVTLLIPFAICWIILSSTFIKSVTANHGFTKVKYRERNTEQKSQLSALCSREFSRLFSSSLYLMNSSIGAFMTFAGGIAIIFFGSKIRDFTSMMGLSDDILIGVLTLFACMLGSMTYISACAVSMEGKNLWIAKSIPANAQVILKSKLITHACMACPAVLAASTGITIAMRPDFLNAVMVFILPMLFTLAADAAGLMFNLKFPLLDWINEAQACKNGLAVLLAMLVPWGVALAFGLCGWFAAKYIPVWAIMGVYSVLLAVITVILYRWNMRKGAAIYESL